MALDPSGNQLHTYKLNPHSDGHIADNVTVDLTQPPSRGLVNKDIPDSSRIYQRATDKKEDPSKPNKKTSKGKGDVNYEIVTRSQPEGRCNGGIVAKQKLTGEDMCKFAMVTARHCIQQNHENLKSDGTAANYVVSYNINGKSYQTLKTAEFRPDVDFALVFMKGSCEAIPDEQIAKLAAKGPEPTEPLHTRRSQVWNLSGYPAPNHFANTGGTNVAGVAMKLLKREAGLSSEDEVFDIKNGTSIQPGDGGMPIFNSNDEIVGVLSASFKQNKPPFTQFRFPSDEVLPWTREQIKLDMGQNPGS